MIANCRGWVYISTCALLLFANPSLAQQTSGATPTGAGTSSNSAQPEPPTDAASTTSNPPAPATPQQSTPTTNVGNTSNSNVQNIVLTLSSVTQQQLGPIVNVSQGTVQWAKSEYDGIKLSKDNLVRTVCTNEAAPQAASVIDDGSTYTLINVIRLNDSQTQQGAQTQTVASNNWYLLSDKNKRWYQGWPEGWSVTDFDGATRLYGAKNLIIVSIVLNATTSNSIGYTFTVTKATASNVAAVTTLLGSIIPAGAQTPKAENGPVGDWGCSAVPVAYKDSTIKVATTYPSGDSKSSFTSSLTFTNESRQYWDVSFALPVKKVSALQYNSTANTVTASQINKQSLFAVADLYFPPANLTATSYSLIPHPFAGVAMNSQPLDSILVGGSIGLHLAEVYAGALFLKQQQLTGLSSGASATPTQVAGATTYGYKASFSIGIKISINTAINALTKSK